MKAKPILFSGPMVRAILEGRKTQTRRVAKIPYGWTPDTNNPFKEGRPVLGRITSDHPKRGCFGLFIEKRTGDFRETDLIPNPYGQPGDLLWVRETFSFQREVDGEQPPFSDSRPIQRRDESDVDGMDPAWMQPHYRATDPAPDLCCESGRCRQCADGGYGPHWKPSIHMPRWASRLTLRITNVRVERLQDISDADAAREGAAHPKYYERGGLYIEGPPHDGRIRFQALWNSINGPESWKANPWVWVIEYEANQANVDQVLREAV